MEDMSKMRASILAFLIEHQDKEYTALQIASHLGLKKDNKIFCQKMLNQLIFEGMIGKRSNRYFAVSKNDNPPVHLPDIDTTNDPPTSKGDPSTGVAPRKKVIYQGKFDATSLARNYSFAFVLSEDGTDIFVSAEDTLNAYHGDIVDVEITRSKNDKKHGVIKKVVKRAKEKFIGVIEVYKKKRYFRCDSLKIHTLFEMNLEQNVPDNHKVMVEVINWGLRQKSKLPMCKVVEVLGVCGEPEVEILSVIKEFDLPMEFPEAVIEEAGQFPQELCPTEIARRNDLRDLYTLTIDPVSAKDFDDAISIVQKSNGDYHLYVHISDVAYYVQLHSELFKEAVNRGNSYYFPKKVIPMLPERLSNKLCSLRPDEDKFTITCLTVFSPDFEIKSQQVFESVIRSKIRLAYEEVDDYFDNNVRQYDDELYQNLDKMRKISRVLSKNRYDRGYLKFELPEVEYIYDEQGYISDIVRSSETESHVLIENFMLLANEYVATLLTKKAKSTMYRIHEAPDDKDLHKIRDMLRIFRITFEVTDDKNKTWQNALECLPTEKFRRVFDRLILRSMKKAKYSVSNMGHFGLGLKTYTHFTSPIRRLCDLLIHMQLKLHCFKQNISARSRQNQSDEKFQKLDAKLIFTYAGVATEKESIADESERMMETKVIVSYMKQNIGKSYKGIINNMNHNTIFVELDDIPVRGVIKLNQLADDYYEFDEKHFTIRGKRTAQSFTLCDPIEVIVASVTDDVYFTIISSCPPKSRQVNPKHQKYKGKKRRK
jgi:ribonuclease R